MLSLLRTDFKRFFKDKTVLVTLCLVVGFAFLSCLIYLIFDSATISDSDNFTLSGYSMFLSTFNPSSNSGFIIPMLLTIVLVRDFTNGTIRNKIISGSSRFEVYLSATITTVCYGLGFYLLNAILTLGLGSLFFGFGQNLTASLALDMLVTTLLCSLVYVVYLVVATIISFVTRNMGLSIICTIVAVLIFGIFATLSYNTGLADWLVNICNAIPHTQIDHMVNGELTSKFFSLSIICSIIYISGITVVGAFLFKKSDVK